MTKDEALKMAIDWLDNDYENIQEWVKQGDKVRQACKEALEQPAQEPVADYVIIDGLKYPSMVEVMAIHNERGEQTEDNCDCINAFLPQGTKLYTYPAPSWQTNKEFVLLSDDEIIDMYFQASISPQPHQSIINFIRAIEQELKRKNGFSDIKEKNHG